MSEENDTSSATDQPVKDTGITAGARAVIQVRATKSQVSRIDAAATFLGLTRSAFMRQAAWAEAVRVLNMFEPAASAEVNHE